MKIRAILNDGQALDLPHDTPAEFGRDVGDENPPDGDTPTLFEAACDRPAPLESLRDCNRRRRDVWLTAEQSPTGAAGWFEVEVEPLWAQCERLQGAT